VLVVVDAGTDVLVEVVDDCVVEVVLATTVVTVVVVEVEPDDVPEVSTAIGVVSPGAGCQPGGGPVCEGTVPAVAITTGAAGVAAVGVTWTGTGVLGSWIRPKPVRSDHQMELTLTTSPV
jgi:hypothetical protein